MSQDQEDLVSHAIRKLPVSIVLTDSLQDDNPITFVNDAFQRTTLYSREYALGRNCRFLQGEKTEPERIAEFREKLATNTEFQITVTNHKADGTPFRNQVLVSPIFDDDGTLTAHFSVQREVREAIEGPPRDTGDALGLLRELQHRVKNHLAMVVSMIRMQARREVTRDSFVAVGRRIEALALLYEEMFTASQADGSRGEKIKAGAYLSRIASVVSRLAAESRINLSLDCDEIDLPVDHAARLGLLLSELLTNAYEHAFVGRDHGQIDVRFKGLSSGGVRLSVEDDGTGLPEGSTWPYDAMPVEAQASRAEQAEGTLDTTGHNGHSGVGGTIIRGLTEMLGASLDVHRAPHGTIVTVDLEPKVPEAAPVQGSAAG